MKTAITVVASSKRVSPMYDVASHAMILEDTDLGDYSSVYIDFPVDIKKRKNFISANKIDLLITGAISNEDAKELSELGVGVCSFVSGDWQEVWLEWRSRGCLSKRYLMPGSGQQGNLCCQKKL